MCSKLRCQKRPKISYGIYINDIGTGRSFMERTCFSWISLFLLETIIILIEGSFIKCFYLATATPPDLSQKMLNLDILFSCILELPSMRPVTKWVWTVWPSYLLLVSWGPVKMFKPRRCSHRSPGKLCKFDFSSSFRINFLSSFRIIYFVPTCLPLQSY